MATVFACTLVALALIAPAPARELAAPTAPAPAPASKNRSEKPATSPPAPVLDWRARLTVALARLDAADPARRARLEQLQPDRAVEDALFFTQPELHDPRAAPVLLNRLLRGRDPVQVRCALVDALPLTGGDWQEAAAALVSLDASPRVRKQLVEVMRYAGKAPALRGLRAGFKDEEPEVNVAAARTAGFSKAGAGLFPELYSSTFSADWDLRAAAVQALGMLRLPRSREVLLKALGDDEREVRLQALLALERLDPEGILYLPELEVLARDRDSHRISRKAGLLLRKRRAAEKAAKRAGRASTAKAPPPRRPRAPADAAPAPRAPSTGAPADPSASAP